MVHHSKDLQRLQRENLRGGHGPVATEIVYKADEMLGKATLFNRLTVKPGSTIGGHTHETDAEIYYVLSGEVVANDDGAEVIMGAGDAMFTGGGGYHALENRSGSDAVILAIVIA